jgi:ABC-type molybdate transport system ATPase subunit
MMCRRVISRKPPNEAQRAESDNGKVVSVQRGQTTGHVRIDIGNGIIITSSITNEAIDELGLAVGDV